MAPLSEWGSAKPGWLASICIGAIRHGFARGLLKRPLRRVLHDIGDSYDIEVDGLRMRCHVADNTVERTVVERGIAGLDTLALITEGLRPGDVFVDVGANCGLFSLVAARKVGPGGRVIAIEPLPEMIDRLRFNIDANKLRNVDVFETAVGEDRGSITLYVDSAHLGRSCMSPMAGYLPTTVPVDSLSSIVRAAGISRIAALKIDIEGHEDRALLPFISSMEKSVWPKKIMMETLLADRWRTNCMSELAKAGYRQTWRSKMDILLEI
jgi:FkbM family methyltransferase